MRAGLIALGVLVLPGPASAQEARATPLVVERSPGAGDCPDAGALAAIEERVAGRRGLEPSADPGAPGHVEVHFTKGSAGYSGIIRPPGEVHRVRTLSDPSPTCAPLAQAISLALALLVDEIAAPVTEALAQSGDRASAVREAETFTRMYPLSPLSDRVRAAVAAGR
jgi:hypothetical protein